MTHATLDAFRVRDAAQLTLADFERQMGVAPGEVDMARFQRTALLASLAGAATYQEGRDRVITVSIEDFGLIAENYFEVPGPGLRSA